MTILIPFLIALNVLAIVLAGLRHRVQTINEREYWKSFDAGQASSVDNAPASEILPRFPSEVGAIHQVQA